MSLVCDFQTDVAKDLLNFMYDSVCDLFDCKFSFVGILFTLNATLKRNKVGLGTIKLLDGMEDSSTMDSVDVKSCTIGLVETSVLKSLKTCIKRFNNLFFAFISSEEATLLIHLEKRIKDRDDSLSCIHGFGCFVPVLICRCPPFNTQQLVQIYLTR
ncbi:2968_t:CDS:1 [Entrophospora sp. SA101]|nr:2968_t:CDS:1 [Entrophospora sp. SA101]